MSWITLCLSLFIIGSCIVFLATTALRDLRSGRPSSGLLLAALFGLEYMLRPLYIYDRGEIGWDPGTFTPVAAGGDSFSSALVLATMAISVLTCAFAATRYLRTNRAALHHLGSAGHTGPWRGATLWTVSTAALIVVSAVLASRAADGGSAFSGDFGRQNFATGYAYFAVNLPMTAILSGLVLAHSHGEKIWARRPRRLLALGIPFIAVHTLWTGGRNESIALLVGVSMLGLLQASKIRLRYLVVGAAISILALASYRVSTREVLYSGELQEISLVSEISQDPIGVIVRGDVSSFDKLYILHRTGETNLGGATYVSASTILLPGFADADGGNQVLTRIADPDRYDRGVTFEGVSYFAEAYLSFGRAGLLIAAAALGVAAGVLDRWARTARLSGLFVWAMFQGALPTLIRADAENYVAAFAPHFVLGVGLLLLLQRRTVALPEAIHPSWPSRPGELPADAGAARPFAEQVS